MESNEDRWGRMMTAAQQGDKTTYNCLLGELSESIASYLLSRFGPLPLLDDCVQESLIAIHAARKTYDDTRPFKPWLYAIVKYKTIDVIRKNQRHNQYQYALSGQGAALQTASFSDADELSQLQVAPDTSMDTQNRTIEELICNAQLLARLPRHNSEALVMTKYLGYSVDETAKALKISNMAVKQRVRRAILKARDSLAGEAS